MLGFNIPPIWEAGFESVQYGNLLHRFFLMISLRLPLILISLVLLLTTGVSANGFSAHWVSMPADLPPIYGYEVIATYPHDPHAFTQGLVIADGTLYEGTGLKGRSTLRRVILETGEVVQSLDLAAWYFGEGITVVGDRIYQLTWQEGTGFIYDRTSFQLLDTFFYDHEGWGITYDGEYLIVSDGSDTLRFWDPETLEEVDQVQVRDGPRPVALLNELEYIDGEIYANIWQTDRIARIDPDTGRVRAWIDLTGLLPPQDPGVHVDVLNGIAYDRDNDRLYVTGKLWPNLFQIRLIPPRDEKVFLSLISRSRPAALPTP